MTVYLDLVMMLNFLVDFLLLLGTNRLSGFPSSPGRCALSAVLGAVYAGVCLTPGFSFLTGLLWRCVSLVLMAGTAFGLNVSAIRRGGIFLLLSLAMGGAAMAIGRGEMPALILTAVFLWLLCRVCFGDGLGGKEYVPIQLCFGEKHASFLALKDTGNTLRDPLTGEQVLVISGSVACRLTGLTENQIRSPVQTVSQRPLPGLRLIPCRTVGQGKGMLLGMRMDQTVIGSRQGSAIVAFAPEGFSASDMVQGLTGGNV